MKPSMKLIVMALLCLSLIGCAETQIYEKGRDGQTHLIARIQGDAWNVTVKTRRTYFHADSLVHSTATVAGGKASARVIGASTGIATTIVTHGAVVPSVLPGIFANIADWFENLFRN
jgi:hypothetical protein